MTPQQLHDKRQKHGLSQRAFARKTNGKVSYGTIRNFEAGKTTSMRPALAQVIQDVLSELEQQAA